MEHSSPQLTSVGVRETGDTPWTDIVRKLSRVACRWSQFGSLEVIIQRHFARLSTLLPSS